MTYRQRYSKLFDKTNFKADHIKVNWDSFYHDPDTNVVFEHFLKIVQTLLDKHAPYENVKHSKSPFESKP